MEFWNSILSFIKSAGWVLAIFGGATGIIITLILSLSVIQNIGRKKEPSEEQMANEHSQTDGEEENQNTKVKKARKSPHRKRQNPTYQIAAIVFATVFSCLFMVLVSSAFNNLAAEKLKNTVIDEENAGVRAARAEVERRKAQNLRRMLEKDRIEKRKALVIQDIAIVELNNRIKLLEGAGMRMQNFQSILQMALLQAEIKETVFKKEILPDYKSNFEFDLSQNYHKMFYRHHEYELLAVISHDTSAKFGIDLNEVKIAKITNDTVSISGIHSIFIGNTKNIANKIIKEIRLNSYDSNGELTATNVLNSAPSVVYATKLADTYIESFSKSLREGEKLEYMDSAVIQLAQNFLTVILSPLYSNIRFDERDLPGALPLMDFFQKEIEDIRNIQIKIMNINDDPSSVILPSEDNSEITSAFDTMSNISLFNIDTLDSMKDCMGLMVHDFSFNFIPIEGEDGFYFLEEVEDCPAETSIKASVFSDNGTIINKAIWAMNSNEDVATGEYNNIVSLLTQEMGKPTVQIDNSIYWKPGGIIISADQNDSDVNVMVWIDN